MTRADWTALAGTVAIAAAAVRRTAGAAVIGRRAPAAAPTAPTAAVPVPATLLAPNEPAFDLHGIRYVYGAPAGRARRGGPAHRAGRAGGAAGRERLGQVARSSSCSTASWRPWAARCARWAATCPLWPTAHDAFRFHREVGMVFQDPDIQLFSATVRDDVAFGPLQLGLSARRGPGRRRRRARPDGDRAPRRPRAVRAVGRREEARGDRVRALAGPGRAAARRAHGGARPAHEVGARQPDPAGWARAARRWSPPPTSSTSCRSSRTAWWCWARTGGCWLTGRPTSILADRDLLIRANLIHEHLHEHGGGPARARPRRRAPRRRRRADGRRGGPPARASGAHAGDARSTTARRSATTPRRFE